jgi:N-acetylmuramic acid 6-phosphate etherase
MLDDLTTEARNPASDRLDDLSPRELVALMAAEDARAVAAVASQAEAIAAAIERIAERLRAGGRLVYAGAGTSGRLGLLDATECPPTFNTPPELVVGLIAGGPPALTRAVEGAEDDPSLGERDLAAIGFSERDTLVGIATSGRTPYVLGAVAWAKRLGAFTVGLSCNAGSELAKSADLAITPVVGPEVLSGSTRLKAGTATKLVLNMLSTGAMVRLGKTFGNLMVDLRASNSKLRARANRIVRTLTGLDRAAANELLRLCGGELKTALVAQMAGVVPEEARGRLASAGGMVRWALSPFSRDAERCAKSSLRSASRLSGEGCLLGIDGGGSHTVALLADANGSILGRGEAGPSNIQAVGVERGLAALDEAVTKAFAAAGRPRGPVASAWLGLAGADRPEDARLITDWATRVGLAARVEVSGDARLLLAAGTPAGWGVAVVAGTGSIAFGRSPDGRTSRAGGWGYLLGDEGSGYDLAVAALQAITRASDGRGPATALTERFLNHLGLRESSELVPAVYRGGRDRAALAALAPLVLASAEAGDAVADAIVEEGAWELAEAVVAAARPLELERGPLPLALAGGLLLESERYRGRLLHALEELEVQVEPVELVREPAAGAVGLAGCVGTPERFHE